MAENKSFKTGDILNMKKNHACSKEAKSLLVLFAGSDIKVKCTYCGHEMLVPRVKLEKNIKCIIPKGEN